MRSRLVNNALTEDKLAKMSDDELKSAYLSIRAKINAGKRKKKNVKYSEIELCYIQREIENRKISKIAWYNTRANK